MNSQDRRVMNIGLVIAVISVLGAAVAGGELEESGDEDGGGNDRPKPEGLNDTQSNPDLNEGATDDYDYLPGDDPGAIVTSLLVRLNWSDEAALPLLNNEPDRFNLTVNAPDETVYSEEAENDADGTGEIVIEISGEWQGSWTISVTMVEAGDQVDPILGITVSSDSGNGYQVDVFFRYWPAK